MSDETLKPFDYAGYAEKMAASLFYSGVVANFSPASVAGADLSVNAMLGLGPATEEQKKKHAGLEWELGCYLGEVFCRRLGGKWHAGSPLGVPTSDPLCYHIIWPSGFMTCPFVYISKRLENGANHSMFSQFDACRKVLLERGDIPDLCDSPQEWYEQGYIIAINKKRPDLGGAFLRMALRLDPNHAEALHWLAMISPASAEGNQQAHQLLDRALAARPDFQQSWVAKVRRYVAAGDRDNAGVAVQNALNCLPNDPELNELLGDHLAFRKDIDGAMAAFEKGTGRSDSAHAWEGLGICRQIKGDLDGAVDAWRQAADRDSKKPMPCYRLAAAEEQRGNRLKAVAWYKKALERKTSDEALTARIEQRIAAIENDSGYLKEQADACASRGDTAGAVAWYEQIAAANPGDGEAWREAGVGHAMLQQFEQALACFDTAIKVNPDDYRGWDHKAVALGRMDKYPLGLDVLDQGLSYCLDSPALWSRRSFFLNKLGRYQEALVSANKALQLEPDNGRHYLFKYEAERQLGQTAAAIDSISHHIDWLKPREPQKAIEAMRMRWEVQHNAKLGPQAAEELQNYAFHHWQAGDVEKALNCFIAALESDPFSSEIWNNYGSALSGIGRVEDSVGCFERADALYPLVTTFLSNKALALARLFRNDEALACHEQILKRSPKDEQSLEELVRLLGVLERWDDALVAANRFVELYPDRSHAHKRVAWVLQQVKRYEEALQAMDHAIRLAPDNRELWLAKSTILSDLGRSDDAYDLQCKAFEDEQFAEQYHRDGLKLFDALNPTRQ
jgi:tetratricopeptide (TPR) repeat protein